MNFLNCRCFMYPSNFLQLNIEESILGEFFVIYASTNELKNNSFLTYRIRRDDFFSFMVPIYFSNSNEIEYYIRNNTMQKQFYLGKIDILINKKDYIKDCLNYFKSKLIRKRGL